MAIDRQQLEGIFQEHGFDEFRWLPAADITVAQWVRMKCTYGCDEYGKSVACPPKNPPVSECERFMREYSQAAIFHFIKAVRDHQGGGGGPVRSTRGSSILSGLSSYTVTTKPSCS